MQPRKRERPTRWWAADICAFLAFNSIASAYPIIGLSDSIFFWECWHDTAISLRTLYRIGDSLFLDKCSFSRNWGTVTILFYCLDTLLTGNFYRCLFAGIWHYQGWRLGPYWQIFKWDSKALLFVEIGGRSLVPLTRCSWRQGMYPLQRCFGRDGGWRLKLTITLPWCFNSIATSVANCTRRPSSGRTFWLKTSSNIFKNSPLRFLSILMLIKTKEHTRQRSETFSLGLFIIVKKKNPEPFLNNQPKEIRFWRAHKAAQAPVARHTCVARATKNFTGLAKFQSQQIIREI